MNNYLEASAALVNEKVGFQGISGENPPIFIDYVPPIGDGKGYMPLQLVLVSLASCSGSTVVTLLRRMNKQIDGLEVKAKGIRREEHPLGFKSIELVFAVESLDVSDEEIKKAIHLSETSFCPVWCMLKGNVEISYKYEIISQ